MRVVAGAAATVYSSDQMAALTIADLDISTAGITSVPFGINLETALSPVPKSRP